MTRCHETPSFPSFLKQNFPNLFVFFIFRVVARRLLAEELKLNGRGWLIMPPVPFAPGEVCEVMPEASRDAEGRWHDPRGIISEGRIFTLNTDGTRRQAWTIINGRPEGDARLFAEGVGIARVKFHDGKVVQRVPASDRTDWEPQGSLRTQIPSPCPPGLDGHWLGTDESGHDMVARLFGGFRILLLSALIYLPCMYGVGLLLGASMGYFGGWFDMACQRLIEVWSNIPFLYAIIFLASLLEPSLGILILILVAFSWIGLAQQLRAAAYRLLPGERLRVAVSCADFPRVWPTPVPATLGTPSHAQAAAAPADNAAASLGGLDVVMQNRVLPRRLLHLDAGGGGTTATRGGDSR